MRRISPRRSHGRVYLIFPPERAGHVGGGCMFVPVGDNCRVAEIDETDDVRGGSETEECLDGGIVDGVAGSPNCSQTEGMGGEEHVLDLGGAGGDLFTFDD